MCSTGFFVLNIINISIQQTITASWIWPSVPNDVQIWPKHVTGAFWLVWGWYGHIKCNSERKIK